MIFNYHSFRVKQSNAFLQLAIPYAIKETLRATFTNS